ncbi:uncharacterized protein AB675_10200 [Cyphellophora attinorum]|uniref:Biogenesis of lysosome-related organelles complex 1 subunit KXD1 n=1 Tax=Cyphellophora attinorum TaxID=1664694 RepID=A0A0N1NXE7_9EURO|nr:uncharacterized protein AB675_10200 [Phialophora attinorum]KPI34780.1 hypothetical protein AB675_10200 [Phialophora attinorum]
MAATYSRHQSNRHTVNTKTLPISLPSKSPAYSHPVSRVAISPPEYSDYSSTGSSRHSAGSYSARSRSSYASSDYSSPDYDSGYRHDPRDIDDMLSDRMNKAFDPIKMDRALARQTQDSGKLNDKERQLRELQDRARARLKSARVKFDEGVEDAKEIRRDLDYCRKGVDSMKSRSEKQYPEAYAKAKDRRSRHT